MPALQFVHEHEAHPGGTPVPETKKCGYCGRRDGSHTGGCKRRPQRAAACECGGVSRHKAGCPRHFASQAKKRIPATRKSPKPSRKAKGERSLTELGQAVNEHRTAEALAIAREKAQESLTNARTRLLDASADVRALERMVAALGG